MFEQIQPAKSLVESVKATKVDYRYLGKSGLRVSVPILGCQNFGDPSWEKWAMPEEQVLPILKYAFDNGLNTWDTANSYSNGASEIIIGKAIKKYNIPRHKLVILTKCFNLASDEDVSLRFWAMSGDVSESKDYVNQYGLSRQAIFHQVERSLERLGVDYIDLLQIHRLDPQVPAEETLKALHDLVQSGKVRYIGASSMWATEFAQLQFTAEKNGWTKFISMQGFYNLLYREEEREMNRFCNATGVGLIPYGPLSSGHLARAPSEFGKSLRSADEKAGWAGSSGTIEPDVSIIARLQEIAAKRGWSMSHVALAWINEKVTSPIIGGSSVSRLEEILGARGKTLTEDEVKYLEALYKPKQVLGHA